MKKNVSKKFMVYSMLGLMQFGLFTNVASASPNTEGLSFWEQCYKNLFRVEQSTEEVNTNCDQVSSKNANSGQFLHKLIQKTCNK